MAPTRKLKGVNRRFSSVDEVSQLKDANDSKKSVQRKRKLSDMLGSQWSKEELEHFYEAYRKYGKDWKKVGAAVRNRSMEMVEALYMMNKAYLSLPDGIASVVGLTAMMTDHYNNLVGSDSDQESNDGGETSRKSQKRGRGSTRAKASKASEEKLLSHSDTAASNSDCLSLLKKPTGGTRPRAVGKRTPRVPVSFSYENVGRRNFVSPTRQGLKPNPGTDNDSVEHEVALALAGASQRGGSPPVSPISSRRAGKVTSSRLWRGKRMDTETKVTSAKHLRDVNEYIEGNSGNRTGDKGELARGRSSLMGGDDSGTALRKGRRIYEKNLGFNNGAENHLDVANTETEGQNSGVKAGKIARHISRKKSQKALLSGDEVSAFDALQTLADLSLMMPAAATDNEKEDNFGFKSDVVDTDTASHQQDRLMPSEIETHGNQAGCGASTDKKSNLGKGSAVDHNGIHERNEQYQKSTSRLSRKKKMFPSKFQIPREVHNVTRLSESQEAEVADAGKVRSKGKFSLFSTSLQNERKMIGHPEHSSPSAHLKGKKDESDLRTEKVLPQNQADLPHKIRSRRKMDLQKPPNLKDLKKIEMLSNCLSSEQVRRWCAFEWFYSAIDYPWFAKREFEEYLIHVGLGHVPRLTHVEWGVIRSSLGKPRRFSEQFLKEEKEKLNHYRDSVRKHYSELREGAREGLPRDLARPLSVGQRVIAIHPKTREIHDGSVLTVDHNRFRIQFDRTELGVEFVLDIDCMPLNPLENIPASLARKTPAMDKLFACFNELKMSGQTKDQKLDGANKISSCQRLEHDDIRSHLSPAYGLSNLTEQEEGVSNDLNAQAKVGTNELGIGQQVVNSDLLTQMQAKEADVHALAELSRALEKKEAVVSSLRYMNDVFENQRDSDNTLNDSDSFKKQYAALLVQLGAINDQVSRALQDLRQRNTYHNSSPAWLKATSVIGDSGGPSNSSGQQEIHVQEFGSQIHDIVASSKREARKLVDTAFQALSSLKIEENASDRIQEAVDYICSRLSLDDSIVGATRPFTSLTPIQESLTLSTRSEHEFEGNLGKKEHQVPAKLISDCVATLLVIQKCTEQQFPPEEVAEILDTAVVSLKPSSQQNIGVYEEIIGYMRIVRNQILARIP